MAMGYNWYYFLKKAYSLYPGVVGPVSATVLEAHYERRRRARAPLRALFDALMGMAFHLWIPWRAWRVQKRFSHDAQWRRRAIAVARARFADPNDIALFRISAAEDLRSYIRRYEDAGLNKLLNPMGWSRHCVLADKRRFAQRCVAAGIPHPCTVARYERGALQVLEPPAGRELLAKPAMGEGGSGIRLLGSVADAQQLAATWSTQRGLSGPMLIQPRLGVHPALRDVALSALPTVRIVTIRDEQGMPEVVSATFRCPTDPQVCVDNMKAGGLISSVTLETGRLGSACHGYGGGDHIHHPTTGAPIRGRQLPDWQAARALAVRAHAVAFREYVLIGWDVALTADGPMLLEGNGKPSVSLSQRAAGRGLAQGRYGELLAHHLAGLSSR